MRNKKEKKLAAWELLQFTGQMSTVNNLYGHPHWRVPIMHQGAFTIYIAVGIFNLFVEICNYAPIFMHFINYTVFI